jgi:hypothetical protein
MYMKMAEKDRHVETEAWSAWMEADYCGYIDIL